MIDIENQIYTLISDAVKTEYPNAKVESVLNLSPSEFPCVCVEEINNTTYRSSSDSGSIENHAELAYEVNIFSNKLSGKKMEVKKISAIVDEIFANLNFIRTASIPSQLDDSTKYRKLLRYAAVSDKNGTIYRR